jgi:hypothetical protein
MKVEYELDQWEWQGTTHSIDIDPEDYQDMSVDEIKQAIYREIFDDAKSNLHLVYAENEVAQEVFDATKKVAGDDDDT